MNIMDVSSVVYNLTNQLGDSLKVLVLGVIDTVNFVRYFNKAGQVNDIF